MKVTSPDFDKANSHPVRLLCLHGMSGILIIDSQISDKIDDEGVRYEFELMFYNEEWNHTAPRLFVFNGHCSWFNDGKHEHSWWEFDGEFIPATVPEWSNP